MSNERKIYRSSDRVIAGVCGGIAEFFDLDPTLVRLVYAFFTVTTLFSGFILYIIACNATDEQTNIVKGIFDNVGQTYITDEKHLGAGTTLASCGIAYAMRYFRAASEGGVELGFKADVAKDIVLQTVKGAVELLQANGNHPEAEIDKVTTPGGLTIRGLNEMEHAGFTSAVIRGLKAGLK